MRPVLMKEGGEIAADAGLQVETLRRTGGLVKRR